MAILYICDKEKYCNISDVCGKECNHTADKDHAKYKEHKWFTKIGANSWEQDPTKENKDGSS